MNERGQYGSPRVGAEASSSSKLPVFANHGIGAELSQIGTALDQIDVEMEAIVDAAYRAMGVDPAVLRRPAVADEAWMQRVREAKLKMWQSPLRVFWENTISPDYENWKRWRWRATIWDVLQSQPPSWDDYGVWLNRVQRLRSDMKAKGISLVTPDLVDLRPPHAPPPWQRRTRGPYRRVQMQDDSPRIGADTPTGTSKLPLVLGAIGLTVVGLAVLGATARAKQQPRLTEHEKEVRAWEREFPGLPWYADQVKDSRQADMWERARDHWERKHSPAR